MAKKITINFQDDFAPGEFASFSKSVIQALHSKFPGFLIHTNVMKPYLEQCHVRVFGLFNADESNSVEQAVAQTVDQMLLDRDQQDRLLFNQQLPMGDSPSVTLSVDAEVEE